MKRIVILGAGNVATHLFEAFAKASETEVVQVYNHRKTALDYFRYRVDTTCSLKALKPADFYLIAIKDDRVEALVKRLKSADAIIAHTSGSVPLQSSAKRNGVFYPLQTFSKHIAVDFSQVPMCIEADTTETEQQLIALGEAISRHVYQISTTQRKSLHLAAVFACNFTNHLYAIAEKICSDQQIPFSTLHALIDETAHKAQKDSPAKNQTGPGIRHDQQTIDSHLQQLQSAELKEIYKLLTQSIQNNNGQNI